MKSRRRTLENRVNSSRRKGLVAVTEIVVIVSVMAGLFLLGTQMFSNGSQEAASSSRGISKAVSRRTVYRLALNQQGDRLWVYRPREHLVQLELPDGGPRQSIPLAGYDIQTVAHSSDGETSIICTVEGSAFLWRNGEEVAHGSKINVAESAIDAAVSPQGEIAVCVTTSGDVHGWVSQDSHIQSFRYGFPHGASIQKIGLSQSGRTLTLARADGTISFHETTSGIAKDTPLKLDSECSMFTWSTDDRLLAVTSTEGFTRVYDMLQRTIVADFGLKKGDFMDRPTAIALSPDGQWLVTSTTTMSGIFIANLQTGEHGKLLGHDGIVRCLEFSPKSDRVYSGSYDGTIREWSTVTRQQIRIID